MYKILALFFMTLTFDGFSQDKTDDFLTGTWKVINTVLSPEYSDELASNPEEYKRILELQNQIGELKILFKKSGQLKFKPANSNRLFEFSKNEKIKWRIEEFQIINIYSTIDQQNNMALIVGTGNGNIYFAFDRIPFYMYMNKEKVANKR